MKFEIEVSEPKRNPKTGYDEHFLSLNLWFLGMNGIWHQQKLSRKVINSSIMPTGIPEFRIETAKKSIYDKLTEILMNGEFDYGTEYPDETIHVDILAVSLKPFYTGE